MDGDAATDLARAREALISPPEGARRLGPAALRGALVELHDFWLTSRVAAVGVTRGTALVALGALGRREQAPWSDLDLLLVHDGSAPAAGTGRTAGALWSPLRDAGIGLSAATGTVGEVVARSLEDLDVATDLLDVRPVAGDPAVAERLAAAARRAWRAGARGRIEVVADAVRARRETSREVARQTGADLEHGRGGLRDLRVLDALVAAQLVEEPGADVRAARALLLDLRTELHRRAGRARDVLWAEDAHELAATPGSGFADGVELARSLSGAGRTVAHALDVALRSAQATATRRGLAALRRGPGRRSPAEGVVEHGGEVALARQAPVGRDPALVLRLAAASARTGLPMAPASLRRLADAAPELREPWSDEARGELLTVLGSDGVVGVVEALERAGLWGRLFPEWGAVRDLPPGDRRHRWTVDRHLMEATRHAAARTARVARPDLLLLGALTHDLGRGRGHDHAAVGAELARHLGRRLGLAPADGETLAAMVRHHRLLPLTARRRDPDDPVTVRRVVATLGGDPVLLELLAILAEADALATGPEVWTPWEAALLGDLVGRCRAVMAGRPVPHPRRGANEAAVGAGIGMESSELPDAGVVVGDRDGV
ncbi:[protein-PII] uridylyltransferase [Actinomycetospora sp. C-140]